MLLYKKILAHQPKANKTLPIENVKFSVAEVLYFFFQKKKKSLIYFGIFTFLSY